MNGGSIMKKLIPVSFLNYGNDGSPSEEQEESRIDRLKEELRYTKECLKEAMEECKASREKLQHVNEELSAANEEY
jgi:hypothetical protein